MVKPFKNLLQNQNADDLGTWYVTFGMWDLHLLNVKSNLLPNAFKLEKLWKVDFWNTVEAKVIILTWYETMANKVPKVTVGLSAKVACIGVPSIY